MLAKILFRSFVWILGSTIGISLVGFLADIVCPLEAGINPEGPGWQNMYFLALVVSLGPGTIVGSLATILSAFSILLDDESGKLNDYANSARVKTDFLIISILFSLFIGLTLVVTMESCGWKR